MWVKLPIQAEIFFNLQMQLLIKKNSKCILLKIFSTNMDITNNAAHVEHYFQQIQIL